MEMSCGALVAQITEYLEGRLSWEERLRFEDHLARCPYCDAYLAALHELRGESLSPEQREQLLEAFRDWAGGRA